MKRKKNIMENHFISMDDMKNMIKNIKKNS